MPRFAILAVAAALAASPCQAWNDRGHMTVAAVAWNAMTPAARREAARLLRLNPDYGRWTTGVSAADRDRSAFMRAATWPDAIRGRYYDDGYDPVEPIASQNIGYADRNIHRYWHYRDEGFSPDGTAVEAPPAVNAVSRIALFRNALADPAISDDVKSYDLAWLLHLVGDIHQPLHAAERYTENFRSGDNGGNGVKVCVVWARQCSTGDGLHGFWDGAIGNDRDPSSALRMALHLPAPDPAAVGLSDPAEWATESFALAKRYAYAAPVGWDSGPYRLSRDYHRDAGAVSEVRVALAGARLAALLNAIHP